MNFVTLADLPYFPGLIALLQSMKERGGSPLGEGDQFYLVHEEKLDDVWKDRLTAIGLPIQFIHRPELGDVPVLVAQRQSRLNYALKKLLVLKLPVKGKVAFVDSDMICLNALDGIDDLPSFSAAPDIGFTEPQSVLGRPMFNTGFFIYDPSDAFYADVMDYYNNSGREFTEFGDQDVLNYYFAERCPGKFHYASPEWNMLKRLAHSFPGEYQIEDARFLHFVGEKPWQSVPMSSYERYYIELNQTWWSMFVRAGGRDMFPQIRRPLNKGEFEVRYLAHRVAAKVTRLVR